MEWNGLIEHDGMYAGYRRLYSLQRFVPPFVWSGRVKLNAVMDPPVFGFGWKQGETATYAPKLNFHPLCDADRPNDRNIVIGPGVAANPTVVGISAEMRDVRPTSPYGVRTGYETRWREPLASNPIDGQWHSFRWEVDAVNVYRLLWDDQLVCDVVEKQPATIDPGPVSVGLRLDFLDVQFADQKVTRPMAFDHSRFEWYPTVTHDGVTFSAAEVISSTGAPRPRLATPLEYFVVHYGGAGAWLDPGDTQTELSAIERWHAIPNDKPNEYNSASDSESATWEWAGPYRAAHSAGNNSTMWGHLTLLGLETPTNHQADRLIAGIRRAREQAVAAGYLTPNHTVLPHTHAPGANTSCPGPLYSRADWWDRISAPLTGPISPPTEEEPDMAYIVIPPPERTGMPWLVVSSAVRPATTFDINDGIEQRDMATIPKAYRVEQYDALHKAAGL